MTKTRQTPRVAASMRWTELICIYRRKTDWKALDEDITYVDLVIPL